MSVFTVFFCGTSSNRFDPFNLNYWNGELVSTLASNHPGREFSDWIVVDGPGSGNLQADELFVRPGGYSKPMGKILGFGWKENVAHALQMIKGCSEWQRENLSEVEYNQLKKAGIPKPDATRSGLRGSHYGKRTVTPQALQQQVVQQMRPSRLPTQVNMVGWSRGGISCHMLANAMEADPELRNIPVNIFAVDPVPGLFNAQKKRLTLGRNVRDYVGFYARDERSFGFSAVIPMTASTTDLYLYPMRGRHATLAGNAALTGKGCGAALVEPGLIVRHSAEEFLLHWGVRLANRLELSDNQLMDCMGAIEADGARYDAMRVMSYTRFREGGAERLMRYGLNSIEFSHMLDQRLPLGRAHRRAWGA